jgi:ribosomal protein S27AE
MSTGTPPLSNPPKPQVKALNCPQCGAAIVLRSMGNAETVVCGSCHSILDAKDPNLQILQKFQVITGEVPPLIPLGTRGKIRGTDYEVIGFQRRSITVEGIRYDWHEYVLFNPYKPTRYLTEYQGHWNDISVCKELPVIKFSTANYLGEMYKHFQTADADTNYVLGEFPWQVRVGEHATVTDYVKPPRVLSSEKSANEVTWSIGEYMYGADIWKAFNLPGHAPEAVGVYENQPSPVSQNVKGIWSAFLAFAILLLVLLAGFDLMSGKTMVFDSSYRLNPGEPKGEASFVTDVFNLDGRTSNVEITTSANVDNSWIYVNYALIDQDSGRAWDFGREVSYYHGYDSDGSWTEGSRKDQVVIPSVPSGHYYLRIEPEVDPKHPPIVYTVQVRRDVTVPGLFGVAFLALLLPAIAITWRSLSFERARWAESDHPPIHIGNSEE